MRTLFSKLLTRTKIFIHLDFVILFLIIIAFILTKIFYNPVKLNTPILIVDSTITVNPSEIIQHNLNLISCLQTRESLGVTSIFSANDGIRETRSIYIGIIGILLTVIFSKRNIKKAYFIILCLILLFYALDIHLNDLTQRSTDANHITSSALDFIVKQRPTDSTWFNIDYSKRNSQYPEIKNARIFRKLNAAFNPDIMQMLFFLIPFLSIYLIFTSKYRNGNTS